MLRTLHLARIRSSHRHRITRSRVDPCYGKIVTERWRRFKQFQTLADEFDPFSEHCLGHAMSPSETCAQSLLAYPRDPHQASMDEPAKLRVHVAITVVRVCPSPPWSGPREVKERAKTNLCASCTGVVFWFRKAAKISKLENRLAKDRAGWAVNVAFRGGAVTFRNVRFGGMLPFTIASPCGRMLGEHLGAHNKRSLEDLLREAPGARERKPVQGPRRLLLTLSPAWSGPRDGSMADRCRPACYTVASLVRASRWLDG